MAVTIKKINTQAELKSFILFNHELYKGHPYAVPDFYEDLLDTFNPKKNAALEFCEADYFLAYNEKGKIVGRVAAIINHKANISCRCMCPVQSGMSYTQPRYTHRYR